MKFYRLSEQDIIKLINLGRLSVTYEISDIPDDFITELRSMDKIPLSWKNS